MGDSILCISFAFVERDLPLEKHALLK